HIENDVTLFPSQEHEQPGLVLTKDGMEEYWIQKIVDERRRGRSYQYLVEGDDLWLPQHELVDCKALDVWWSHKAEGMW
ncbi:hypothetical protein L208DRAFT_1327996, partial [Tricholoma matsutake]